MFEFLDDIEKLLKIFNFNFDFMKNFDFLKNKPNFSYFLDGQEFISSFKKNKLFDISGYKNLKTPDINAFKGLFLKENPEDFVPKPLNQNNMLSEVLSNQPNKNNNLKDNADFQNMKNSFFTEENIFDNSKLNFDFMKPVFENKFDINDFKNEDNELQKPKLSINNLADVNKDNTINKIVHVAPKEAIKPDIDYIGSEIAKCIEQASINRSVASAY